MAVLGNRGTGILDMLIEGYRRSGVDMPQPNMSPVGRTPLQQTLNRPEVAISSMGNQMTTTMPDRTMVQASTVPMLQDVTRGRILDSNDPMRPVPEAMPMQQVVERQAARQPTSAPADPMGMQKLAEDASRAVAAGADQSNDPSIMEGIKNYFGSRENMVRLALAFNSMRTRPDTGLAAVLGDELKDMRTTRASSDLSNRTAQYFDTVDPQIANAIRSGLSAKDAIAMFREKEKGVVVGKMIVNPTTGEIIYNGATEGSDLPDAMQTLLARAEQAGLKPGSPEYQQFMINGGQRAGMAISVGSDGTFTFTEGGATPIKLTDSQSNALAFGGRMQASNQILSKTEMEGTQLGQSLLEQVPVAGNYLLSPEYQQYSQAKRNFINAVLRKESGAAIAESEFANADKQYFPQPGDSPAVIQQKRENRELATQLMMAGVPIQGLTENPKVVLERIANDIPRPNTVPQDIWDIMKPQEKLTFK